MVTVWMHKLYDYWVQMVAMEIGSNFKFENNGWFKNPFGGFQSNDNLRGDIWRLIYKKEYKKNWQSQTRKTKWID